MGAAVGAAAAAWLAASTTPRLFGWVACPVVATALVCGSVYSWLRLPFWLGWLASELITRLAMHGYPDKFLFQGVHMLFNGDFYEPWGDTPRVNRLVFIGKNLNRAQLEDDFDACILKT